MYIEGSCNISEKHIWIYFQVFSVYMEDTLNICVTFLYSRIATMSPVFIQSQVAAYTQTCSLSIHKGAMLCKSGQHGCVYSGCGFSA